MGLLRSVRKCLLKASMKISVSRLLLAGRQRGGSSLTHTDPAPILDNSLIQVSPTIVANELGSSHGAPHRATSG